MRHRQWVRRGPIWVAALAVAGILGWEFRDDPVRERAKPPAMELQPVGQPTEARVEPGRILAAAATPKAPALEPKAAALGAAPDASGPGEPAHPIGAERRRLQRELQLIGALNDAFDLQNVGRMRELIEQYRATQPDDVHRLQEGYERLADCLAFPGEASRAEAQRYYDAARASTLRRYIRRTCLESE